MKVGVFGAGGRVGKLLVENCLKDPALELSVVYVNKELDFNIDENVLVTNEMKTFLEACEVVIDFTQPEGTELLLTTTMQDGLNRALVIGDRKSVV